MGPSSNLLGVASMGIIVILGPIGEVVVSAGLAGIVGSDTIGVYGDISRGVV